MTTFRRMMGTFLRGHWPALLLSMALALATTGFGLVIPWLLRAVVDTVLVEGQSDLLVPLSLGILAAGLLRFGAAFARRIVSGHVSLAVETDIRNQLFAHLEMLDLGFYLRSQTGQLISRSIADVRAVRLFLSYGFIFLVTHLTTMVAVTVILFSMQPQLAVVALLPMPILLVSATRFSSRLHPSLYALQQRVAELTAVAEERITGIRVIKALAIEHVEQETFAEASDLIYRQNLDAAAIRARYVPLMSFLPSLSLVAILYLGGRMVVDGSLTLGSLLAFNSYVLLLTWPMRMLGMLISWAERASASGERVIELLDERPAIADRAGARVLPPLRGAVSFRRVRFGYDGHEVLRGIDLHVEAGETVAFVGPTGCGKTTLALLVPRFHDPTEGAVLVDGRDLRDVTLASLRRQIGLVEQDPFLFSLSVRENIRYGDPQATDERVAAAARAAAADDFIRALPEGYDTPVGERGINLSGGQRQRVALARALLVDPRILILDDATSSVDAETEARIMEALRALKGSRTTIVIAHRPSTVLLADRVVLLDAGRVVQVGPPAAVHWDEILVREAEEALARELAAAQGADRSTLLRRSPRPLGSEAL
jgi:ATP-binding cassette subfamily B protein